MGVAWGGVEGVRWGYDFVELNTPPEFKLATSLNSFVSCVNVHVYGNHELAAVTHCPCVF